jgi:hypothetical protein
LRKASGADPLSGFGETVACPAAASSKAKGFLGRQRRGNSKVRAEIVEVGSAVGGKFIDIIPGFLRNITKRGAAVTSVVRSKE